MERGHARWEKGGDGRWEVMGEGVIEMGDGRGGTRG